MGGGGDVILDEEVRKVDFHFQNYALLLRSLVGLSLVILLDYINYTSK